MIVFHAQRTLASYYKNICFHKRDKRVLNVFNKIIYITIQALFLPRKTRRVLEKQDSGDKASTVLLDKTSEWANSRRLKVRKLNDNRQKIVLIR
jgi:hypothetical protein